MFLKFFGKKQEKQRKSGVGTTELVGGFDPAMNYCPKCGDEYRQDIGTCGICEIPLIGGEQRIESYLQARKKYDERSMEISPEDDLVVIRKGALKDIKQIKKILGEHRIPSIIAGDEANCGKGCCGPEMYLQVKNGDVPAASELLALDFIKNTAVDVDDLIQAEAFFDAGAKETVCPACNCKFSPTVGACPDCGLCFE